MSAVTMETLPNQETGDLTAAGQTDRPVDLHPPPPTSDQRSKVRTDSLDHFTREAAEGEKNSS